MTATEFDFKQFAWEFRPISDGKGNMVGTIAAGLTRMMDDRLAVVRLLQDKEFPLELEDGEAQVSVNFEAAQKGVYRLVISNITEAQWNDISNNTHYVQGPPAAAMSGMSR